MQSFSQQETEERLIYYRKKIELLEEIIKQNNEQKQKMAKMICQLLEQLD